MKTILITTSNPEMSSLFSRQTPGNTGVWGDCRFVINEPVECCDWWFVCHYSAIKKTEEVRCDPDHIIFISMEPADDWIPSGFFRQFSQLVLCDRSITHKNIKYANGLTWWVGVNVSYLDGHRFSDISLDYDSLSAMPMPSKKKKISVICSPRNTFKGHGKRLTFLHKLRDHSISEHIDFYGEGFKSIPDKWNAIAPYQYHIVLENSVVPDYWSEKIGDAYLGYALPVYYGCPNVGEYFNNDSYIAIDIENFDESVNTLSELVNNDYFTPRLPDIIDSRNKVLNKYNIFQLMSGLSDRGAGKYSRCQLNPVDYFKIPWVRRTARKLLRK